MKKLKLNKKKGILFFVQGLSGSGKTSISKKIKNQIIKKKENIVGLSIRPEFPKNPHILIKNDFKKSSGYLANLLLKKIKILIRK